MKNQLFKSTLLTLCIAVLSGFYSLDASAQQKSTVQEIKFSQQSYKQVLAKAKAGHKQIFVDAFATWCSPCKELRKRTFKDARAAAYFNQHFINISVDVEKGDGVGLAKRWQVEGLPTLLIVDETGKVLASHTGFVDGNGLIQFAQEAIDSKGALNK
jgi:thiol:disulfide interchange protein